MKRIYFPLLMTIIFFVFVYYEINSGGLGDFINSIFPCTQKEQVPMPSYGCQLGYSSSAAAFLAGIMAFSWTYFIYKKWKDKKSNSQ